MRSMLLICCMSLASSSALAEEDWRAAMKQGFRDAERVQESLDRSLALEEMKHQSWQQDMALEEQRYQSELQRLQLNTLTNRGQNY